jgi:hypothetical protein
MVRCARRARMITRRREMTSSGRILFAKEPRTAPGREGGREGGRTDDGGGLHHED